MSISIWYFFDVCRSLPTAISHQFNSFIRDSRHIRAQIMSDFDKNTSNKQPKVIERYFWRFSLLLWMNSICARNGFSISFCRSMHIINRIVMKRIDYYYSPTNMVVLNDFSTLPNFYRLFPFLYWNLVGATCDNAQRAHKNVWRTVFSGADGCFFDYCVCYYYYYYGSTWLVGFI